MFRFTLFIICSQRADSQSQRPERLGALYNNLMNRFQEYRRDRVVSQVQSQLRQEPVQSTSSWDPVSGIFFFYHCIFAK